MSMPATPAWGSGAGAGAGAGGAGASAGASGGASAGVALRPEQVPVLPPAPPALPRVPVRAPAVPHRAAAGPQARAALETEREHPVRERRIRRRLVENRQCRRRLFLRNNGPGDFWRWLFGPRTTQRDPVARAEQHPCRWRSLARKSPSIRCRASTSAAGNSGARSIA